MGLRVEQQSSHLNDVDVPAPILIEFVEDPANFDELLGAKLPQPVPV